MQDWNVFSGSLCFSSKYYQAKEVRRKPVTNRAENNGPPIPADHEHTFTSENIRLYSQSMEWTIKIPCWVETEMIVVQGPQSRANFDKRLNLIVFQAGSKTSYILTWIRWEIMLLQRLHTRAYTKIDNFTLHSGSRGKPPHISQSSKGKLMILGGARAQTSITNCRPNIFYKGQY